MRLRLRRIHGFVSGRQSAARVVLAAERVEPPGNAHVHFLATKVERCILDRVSKLLGFLLALFLVRLQQDDAKLVAAKPPDNVRIADIFLQPFGDERQGRIACRVTKPVIDGLHVIDIEIDDRAWVAVPLAHGDRPVQLPNESATVVDRQQRILVRQLFKVLDTALGALQFVTQARNLLHQGHESLANFGRNLGLGNTHDRSAVGNLPRARRGLRGASGLAAPRLANAPRAGGFWTFDLHRITIMRHTLTCHTRGRVDFYHRPPASVSRRKPGATQSKERERAFAGALICITSDARQPEGT